VTLTRKLAIRDAYEQMVGSPHNLAKCIRIRRRLWDAKLHLEGAMSELNGTRAEDLIPVLLNHWLKLTRLIVIHRVALRRALLLREIIPNPDK
jgi:hypothetical protein